MLQYILALLRLSSSASSSSESSFARSTLLPSQSQRPRPRQLGPLRLSSAPPRQQLSLKQTARAHSLCEQQWGTFGRLRCVEKDERAPASGRHNRWPPPPGVSRASRRGARQASKQPTKRASERCRRLAGQPTGPAARLLCWP